MTNNKYKILLVEDDGSIRAIMTTMLESAGYQVISADTCGLAKTLFASHLPDVTILDLGLPDMDGMRRWNLSERIRALRSSCCLLETTMKTRFWRWTPAQTTM